MPLQIEARQERSITVIQVLGSIFNQDGASDLRNSLAEQLAGGQHNLLIEVGGVHGMDAAGVNTLRTAQKEAQRAGGDLKIAGARYPFWAVMAYNDATGSFPYYSNSDEALASFSEEDEAGSKGIKRFDILEFVKEQEKEDQEQAKTSEEPSAPE